MKYAVWPAPFPAGGTSEEIALTFDQSREHRLLVLAPLFNEHNKTRRQVVEIMRRLDRAGIDCLLPDLPGFNESLAPLDRQSLTGWMAAVEAAAVHFSANRVLGIRGGALLIPGRLPGHVYEPAKGAQLLRAMLRARTIAAREAGREEKAAQLLEEGREGGLELAGWRLGPKMIRELEQALPVTGPELELVEQAEIGGAPLWLRAEPDDDPEQADALAAILAVGMLGG
ncbi:MAG: hypothetical protein ACR2FJ_07050 [Qipengyuania sp.]